MNYKIMYLSVTHRLRGMMGLYDFDQGFTNALQ